MQVQVGRTPHHQHTEGAHAHEARLTHSLTHSLSSAGGILLLAGGIVATMGQLNLTPDVITFRDSNRKDKATTHYGYETIYGLTGGGYSGLTVWNDATTSGGWATYAVYGFCNTSPNGAGGRFDGKVKGVVGISTSGSTSSTRMGGFFQANGSSSNNYGLYADGSTYAGYFNGSTYCTDLYQGSDARLKTDIVPISDALTGLLKLQPHTYWYDTLSMTGLNLPCEKQYGFVAQELEQVYPELVSSIGPPPSLSDSTADIPPDTASYKCVNYVGLVPVLVKAMQEQQAQIEAQNARIEELSALVDEMKKK